MITTGEIGISLHVVLRSHSLSLSNGYDSSFSACLLLIYVSFSDSLFIAQYTGMGQTQMALRAKQKGSEGLLPEFI